MFLISILAQILLDPLPMVWIRDFTSSRVAMAHPLPELITTVWLKSTLLVYKRSKLPVSWRKYNQLDSASHHPGPSWGDLLQLLFKWGELRPSSVPCHLLSKWRLRKTFQLTFNNLCEEPKFETASVDVSRKVAIGFGVIIKVFLLRVVGFEEVC
jgi:hypothetical protein